MKRGMGLGYLPDALVKDALDRANYWLLIPVLGFLLLSHWLRALRWRQLIEPMGYKPSTLNCFLAVLIGYLVNIGARLGEVVKCTIIARYEKVPADKLVVMIVQKPAYDMICLAIVFGLMNMVGNLGAFAFVSGVMTLVHLGGWELALGVWLGLQVAALLCWFFLDPDVTIGETRPSEA